VLSVRSLFVCFALAAGVFTTVTCTDRLELARGQASLSLVPQAAGPQAVAPQAVAPQAAAPEAVQQAPAPAAPTAPPAATAAAPAAKPTAQPARTPAGTPSAATPAPAPRATAAPPPATSGSGSRQQDLTNQARAGAGLPALQWNACLAGVAQLHAREMAQAGHIYHGDGVQRDLGCGQGFTRAGENVGMTSPGIDDQRIFNGFMASAGHKANILGSYRYIGTAWVTGADGAGYVSVEFAG
jgi:uncharacterized protein YkwD